MEQGSQPGQVACEFHATCEFFNATMPSVPQLVEKLKEKYCYGAFAECARYSYKKLYGQNDVPTELFPNASYF